MSEQELIVREMKVEDIPAVMRVEEASFDAPWTEEIFQHEIEMNWQSVYTVAEVDGTVVGYCGAWIVLDECQVTNIAVHPSMRGRKIGDTLIRKLLERCYEEEVRIISLEVRVTNEVAQRLYRKYGFQNGGIRKDYYTDGATPEDALVMWVELN